MDIFKQSLKPSRRFAMMIVAAVVATARTTNRIRIDIVFSSDGPE